MVKKKVHIIFGKKEVISTHKTDVKCECHNISIRFARKQSNMTREILICRKTVKSRTRSEENKPKQNIKDAVRRDTWRLLEDKSGENKEEFVIATICYGRRVPKGR